MLNAFIERSTPILVGIIFAIINFFDPIKGFLMLMGFMVLADTIFAMWVAHKMNQKITSSKFFNIAPKIFFYLGSIMLAYGCDYLFVGAGPVMGINMLGTKVISFAFISNEVKSINETYVKRFGKSLYETIKEYLSVLKRLKKDIEDLVNGEDKN